MITHPTVITKTQLPVCFHCNVLVYTEYISECWSVPVTVRVVPGKSLLHSKLGVLNLKRYWAESESLRSEILRVECPLSVSRIWTRPAYWESSLRSSGWEGFCPWWLLSGLNQNFDVIHSLLLYVQEMFTDDPLGAQILRLMEITVLLSRPVTPETFKLIFKPYFDQSWWEVTYPYS